MGNIIIAIDPGNIQSGFVVVDHDGREITRVLDKGKADNDYILTLLACYSGYDLAIEMIASYGMAVGVVVFTFSFALAAIVNKVTKREPLEF